MSENWKAKLPFLAQSKPVLHTVGDNQLNFYPSSVGVAFKLKDFLKPIAEAISVLFANNANDSGYISRDVASPTTEGARDVETIIEPMREDLAKFRQQSRQEAIGKLINAFEAKNMHLVGALIMDSIKEVFPRGAAGNPPPQEFIDSLELPQITEMLVGVAKANKGVFGPLGNQMGGIFAKVREMVEEKVQSPAGKVASAAGQAKGPVPTGSTPGTNFKIKSAGSPANNSGT